MTPGASGVVVIGDVAVRHSRGLGRRNNIHDGVSCTTRRDQLLKDNNVMSYKQRWMKQSGRDDDGGDGQEKNIVVKDHKHRQKTSAGTELNNRPPTPSALTIEEPPQVQHNHSLLANAFRCDRPIK